MTWVTDTFRCEHWVTDEAMTLGKITGRYVGLCSQIFLPASLVEMPQARCGLCLGSLLLSH